MAKLKWFSPAHIIGSRRVYPYSVKYPAAVKLLLKAGIPPDGMTDVRHLYAATAKLVGLGIPERELGSSRMSKEALTEHRRTGQLPRIPTAIAPIRSVKRHPQPAAVDGRPPKADKLLWAFGVELPSTDPVYRKRVVEVCQAQYQKRFGVERQHLPYGSAKAILSMMRAGAPVAHPSKADAQLSTKRTKHTAKKARRVSQVPVRKERLAKITCPSPGRVAFIVSDEFLQSYEWRKARYEALKLSDGCCCLCGRGRPHGAILNVDHIKPRRKHPELALVVANLQVLCHDCNHGKGNWDMTDWR